MTGPKAPDERLPSPDRVTPTQLQLGKHVLDKDVVDQNGRRLGKVDDLLLSLDGDVPRVAGIITGPLAYARTLGPWAERAARLLYRLLGADDPQPHCLPWERVTSIGPTIQVALAAERSDVDLLADLVYRRLLRHLPGV